MHSQMTPTPASTNIAGYLYHTSAKRLFIEFRSGRIYGYLDVPQSVVDDLEVAPSKGKFFNADIKDAYAWEEIPASDLERHLEQLGTPRNVAAAPRRPRNVPPGTTLASLAARYPHLRCAVI